MWVPGEVREGLWWSEAHLGTEVQQPTPRTSSANARSPQDEEEAQPTSRDRASCNQSSHASGLWLSLGVGLRPGPALD